MDSPFAPPDPPLEPTYSTNHATAQPGDWPVSPSGGVSGASGAGGSVVLGTAVVPDRNGPKRRAALLGVLALVAVSGGAFALSRSTEHADASTVTTPHVTLASGSSRGSSTSAGGVDVVGVVAKIGPTVVKVAVDIGGASGAGRGVGTGVILTRDGEILTNAHVVENATTVRVVLDGRSEPVDAKVLGSDVGNDLALLKIDGKDLPTMQLANSDDVEVGQPVVAMGYALDLEGGPSVTTGIISAVDRSMVTSNGALDGLLQTDAAISSGNSGGPLVDAAGEMIGINTAVARGDSSNAANNIGFAISTKEINRIIDKLQTAGTKDQRVEGYLGIGVDDRHDGGRGAIVAEVQPGSPAAQLGLKVGDVVTHVDGVEINGQGGLIAAIRDSAPGDTVAIEYSRSGKEMSGTAKLVARPHS